MASENPRPGQPDRFEMKLIKTHQSDTWGRFAKVWKDTDAGEYLIEFYSNGQHQPLLDFQTADANKANTRAFNWIHRSFSRPGAKDTMAVEDRFYFGKERFAITRKPGSCLYANNTGTDVSGYHAAIKKAIDRGGKFDEDFADIFKLTRSPAGSVCLWSLTWA